MFSQWRHRTLKNNEFELLWFNGFKPGAHQMGSCFKHIFSIGCQWKNRPCFKITQVRSSCLWYGRAAREDTTSRILSTGIVVQGTWLMQRSIWLFFHFCWLQITVLKVSSIIIPVHSDALWSHNWRSKWYECKHTNVNTVHGKAQEKVAKVHFGSGIVHKLYYARDPFTSEIFRVNLLSGNLVQ